MPLENEQIQKIVKNQPRKDQLVKAVNHEARLRFHTETILNKRELGKPYTDFINWLGSKEPILLEEGKVRRIDELIGLPISTIELSESIFSRMHRIFNSQDSFFDYQFEGEELEKDWDDYRDKTFWPTKGFQALQSAINSVWVLDLPELMTSDRPEPVNKLIRIEDVIDISVNEDNDCEYVIFRVGDLVYVYDDTLFRAYSYEKGNLSAEPVEEIPHGLDYTPARMFWSENLQSNDTINKESPITKELFDFDWLLFHTASKKYLDIANSFPILVSYEIEGDYKDDEAGDKKEPRRKPEGGFMGAGSHIKIDIPREGDVNLMDNPMKYITPDVESLDWHVSENNRLTNKIFKSVVGADQESRNDAAKNELQIESAYESQISVLMRIKTNFEIIQKFADSTICRIRYKKSFKGCTIDYGTRFFLKSENDLYDDYKHAKESGASDIVLSEINESILDTRFRDNSAGRTRADIINDLDPMPEKTTEETIEILNAGGIDKVNFVIKSNLLNFVNRFERENISLDLFGAEMKYSKRLSNINEKLIGYAKERSDSKLQD